MDDTMNGYYGHMLEKERLCRVKEDYKNIFQYGMYCTIFYLHIKILQLLNDYT